MCGKKQRKGTKVTGNTMPACWEYLSAVTPRICFVRDAKESGTP